jgi:2-polyprenyl-3-methyl-5-hydroxy-6-metoxy-1,4-benzoquinol methylase
VIDNFYKSLYVENKHWNTFKPNKDEKDRWSVIKPLVESLGKTDLNIIDVGCGRGVFSNLISEYGYVLGIDPVSSVIEYGKSLYPNLKLMPLSLQDYVYIFPNKKYDLVLCTEVLEHVLDKVGFISRLKGLVKNDGYIILTTPRKEIQEEWISKFGHPEQPIEEWISTDDLIKMIDDAGLKRLSYKTTYLLDIYQVHLLSV